MQVDLYSSRCCCVSLKTCETVTHGLVPDYSTMSQLTDV